MPADRNVSVSNLGPGSVLTESVFGDRKTKLLRSGFPLNDRLIKRLAEIGVADVTVMNQAKRAAKQKRNSMQPGLTIQDNGTSDTPLPITRSCACGTTLAIQPPILESPIAIWVCNACGSAYFGIGGNNLNYLGVELLPAGDSITEVEGDHADSTSTDDLGPSSASDHCGPERRRQKRFPTAISVVAIPLGEDFRVAGEAVCMAIRNISRRGVSLAHTRFTDAPYFALDFTPAGMELLQVVLKVSRVTTIGPIYEVAGTFISQLVHKPGDGLVQADMAEIAVD